MVYKMTIEEIYRTSESLSNPFIEDWKKQGKRIMGYYCTYIPEEIIHAADVLGFRIRATGSDGTSRADTILSRFNCSFIRATLDLVLEGKYQFLDGLTCMNSCDHARRIYDIFKKKVLGEVEGYSPEFPLYFISVPHIITDHGYKWLKEEFEIFKSNIEKAFGKNITNKDLNNSIKVFNENRQLLKDIHALRILEKPKITGVEALKLNIANTSVPKEIMNSNLKSYLNLLKDSDGISDYRARILVLGSLIDDPSFLNAIEDVGGLIVSDMLCFGTKNFWDLAEIGGEPLDSITKRYYEKISCPRMMDDHNRRFDFLYKQIQSANIDGVIAANIEFSRRCREI